MINKTFKQFILEQDEIPTLDEYLTKHCSAFLKKSKSKSPLLRGMKNVNRGEQITLMVNGQETYAYIMTPRTDRNPTETAPKISAILDSYLEEKFGWRPRSEGVFCTADENTAGDFKGPYGDGGVFKIYPIGDFKFVYLPGAIDSAVIIRREMHTDLGTEKYYVFAKDRGIRDIELDPDSVENIELMDRIKQHLKKQANKFVNTDLHAALVGKFEITLNCKKYLAIKL